MLHGVGPGALPLPALERLLAWIRRHQEPVTLDEIARRLADPARITGREIALTFDDGLANNARLAAPRLARLRVPATFFVCPERIATGRWLWNHEARARLRRLAPDARRGLARELGAPAGSGDDLVAWMKGLGRAPREQAEEALRAATPDFVPDAEEREAFDMMRPEELAALDATWIAVGSHTRTHPILTTLDDADIDQEVGVARRELEALCGRPTPWFCYPNGAQDARVRALVGRHHDRAVTTEPGVVRPGADPVGLPRIGASPSLAETTWRMHRP
jgi:peptidoglycan/xylan/chitin deacetylase (PgdA/CDA1 family)